jgi:quercetin dioxygenase-like cupin family protein
VVWNANRVAPGRYTLGSWKNLEAEDARSYLQQQIIGTERITVVRCVYPPGLDFPPHLHPQEQITIVEEGDLQFQIDGEAVGVGAGQMISIPGQVRHATTVRGRVEARALNLFVLVSPEGGAAGQTGRPTFFHR